MPLRQGQIYWINDCPPLFGHVAAPHAAIILNPPVELKDPTIPLRVMVISSSVPSPGRWHIPMPNKQTHDPCSTCLTKPCWAVSHWILRVKDRSKLGAQCGYITGVTLRKTVQAYVDVIAAGTMPIDHPRK